MKSSSSVGDLSRTVLHGVKADGKLGKGRQQQRDAVTEEMQTYFSKLKELVPFMPKNKKVSKLEIIQHVIDYICDLQLALESHPAARNAAAAAVVSSPTSGTSPTRQPLGVIATPNAIPNTCGAQEVSHLDKTSPHLDDMSSRPVSC